MVVFLSLLLKEVDIVDLNLCPFEAEGGQRDRGGREKMGGGKKGGKERGNNGRNKEEREGKESDWGGRVEWCPLIALSLGT